MNGGEGAGVELFSAEGKAQEILRLSEILEGEEIQQKLEQILDGIVDIVWADRDRLQKGELPHELQELIEANLARSHRVKLQEEATQRAFGPCCFSSGQEGGC